MVDACNTIQAEVSDVLGLVVLDIVEGNFMLAFAIHISISGRFCNGSTISDDGSDPISTNVFQHGRRGYSLAVSLAFPPSTCRSCFTSVTSKTLHNLDSARVSIPPCLVPSGDAFTWRTDLSSTQTFWTGQSTHHRSNSTDFEAGWYENLSKKFLSARTAKLLVLAGTDRLDTELTIGQMQGKYQMTVFPDVGHCLHEDAPERLAALVLDFWKRNDRTDILKHVKKVGS